MRVWTSSDTQTRAAPFQAQISTNRGVKMAFIAVYRFKSSLEWWAKGHSVPLTLKTSDDGTQHSVAAEGNRFAVHVGGKPSTMDLPILPVSFRGSAFAHPRNLPNTSDRSQMRIVSQDLARERSRCASCS